MKNTIQSIPTSRKFADWIGEDEVRVKITAKKKGEGSIKFYFTEYPEICVITTVTVT